jgi:hypothetical protein
MEFGATITNPLLQVAVSAGEATIRRACGGEAGLSISVEMEQYADGRDAILVWVKSGDSVARFSMLLRNYFDQKVLSRVARRGWQQRVRCDETQERELAVSGMACAAGMN